MDLDSSEVMTKKNNKFIIDTRMVWWNAGPTVRLYHVYSLTQRNRYGHKQHADTATETNKNIWFINFIIKTLVCAIKWKQTAHSIFVSLHLSWLERRLVRSKRDEPTYMYICLSDCATGLPIKIIRIVFVCLSKVNWIVIFAASFCLHTAVDVENTCRLAYARARKYGWDQFKHFQCLKAYAHN